MSQFTLALNTSTIRPASLMDKIRIAGETGYEAIELWNDDLTAYEEQHGSLADVKRALDDYGLARRNRHRPTRLVGYHRHRTSRSDSKKRNDAWHKPPPLNQLTASQAHPVASPTWTVGWTELP